MYVLCASSYERGYTGSMAEEGSVYELEGFEKQLGSLLRRLSSDDQRTDSEVFCSDFCKLVEEYVSRWEVPLPRLRVLEVALRCFTQASAFFSSNCDHVLYTLSSLALSLFELLLFFDQKDFHQDSLKQFTVTFQECHLVLARHQNVHLLQVGRLVQGGGPWANSALQAILTESSLPQNGVDGYISSELPVFFELRVRYLLTCERVREAVALAKCCAWHPTAGQHLFFLQVYLTWLFRTSQHDHLHEEVADLSGKDAVHIICSLETEEKDEFLLALTRAFLSQQLCRGDMYYLWELVFIWSKLHGRLRTSKQALLAESHQLMLSATNVNSIFPFIRVILQELGEEGVQFCVELCANALGSCLPYDVVTKSLIYKTIASLLPNDLEVCRACALLVFFLERTIESYKMVYLLCMHPDQEYHAEHSPVGNHIRFETLQVLKKGLYFDPEFWNLIALRTNCLKLMSEKVASCDLEEIMDEKWVPSYSTKESNFCSSTTICQKGKQGAKKRQQKEDRSDMASKRIKVGPGQTRLTVDHTMRKKGPRTMKEAPSEPLRRSFWQLDKLKDNCQFGHGEHRRTTRHSEKNPPKRRIRGPRWLLEDSGTLEGNNVHSKSKRRGMKSQHQKQHRSSFEKRSASGQDKKDVKHRTSLNSHIKVRGNEDKVQKGFPVDYVKPVSPPHVILELSLPDNELLGTFTEETCNRQRGYPQMLLYKPMVKLPPTSQPVKAGHRNEVIVRARDFCTFVQQLHCYARRQKGKGIVPNMRGSVSTITRSSVQGSPPKEPQREVCVKTLAATEMTECPIVDKKVPQTQSTDEASRKTASQRELSEKPAFEIKLAIASKTPAAAEPTESPVLDKVPQAQTAEQVSQNATEAGRLHEKLTVPMNITTASQTPAVAQSQILDLVSQALTTEDLQITASVGASQTSTVVTDETLPVSTMAKFSNTEAADPMPSLSQDVHLRNGESLLESDQEFNSLISHSEACKNPTTQNTANNASLFNNILDHKEAPQIVTVAVKDSEIAAVTEVLPEGSKRHMSSHDEVKGDTPATNALTNVKDTFPGGSVVTQIETSVPEEPDSKDDICDLTLVTEMVTKLAPDAFAVNLDCKEDITSEERPTVLESKPNVPRKIFTTCSSSVTQQGASADADVETKQEEDGTQYVDEDTSEDGEHMEGQQESEESKLEYCCTFCHKTFKGHRVVVHAMFHYRKDECMFCGTLFKDDLLAMMHLSNHIEKLKKSKELADIKAQENQVSGTKSISTPKTSAKAKTANSSPAYYNERLRNKSAGCTKSLNLPESSSSEPRKLRSNNKPADKQILQQKKGNTSKHCAAKTTHKVNGHTGTSHITNKKQKRDTMNLNSKQPLTQPKISHQEKANGGGKNLGFLQNGDVHLSPSATPVQLEKQFGCSTEDKIKETESLQVLKMATKQNETAAEENSVDRLERVYCPVDGCTWSTDPSKNRVALLYHALDDHHGDIGPLQLAFRVGNSRCGVCMRVLWSYEHFQHHVERHRLTPRHPCLHQGCTARFKTGIEMRRHTRKHSPLQALCCLPGCSKQFICLWALNLHEREHYASKPPKTVKKTTVPIADKCDNAQVEKKQQSHTAVTVNRTFSEKAARKLRRQAADNLSAGNCKEWKKRDESKDSNVLKNLSNKNTSTQPSLSTLRLRQRFRKATKTNTASPQIPTSSLLKPSGKVKSKLRKLQVKLKAKCPKRRVHPPGSAQPIKAVRDENTTADQNDETVRENINVKKDQSVTPALPLTRTPEMAQTSAGNEVESNLDPDGVKTNSVALTNENSTNEQVTGVSTPTATAQSLTEVTDTIASSEEKIQKLTTYKLKKKKKRHILKDKHAQTAPSVSSKAKKHKVTHAKVKRPAKTKSETKAPNDEVGNIKEETANSPLDSLCDSIATATTNEKDENLSPPTALVEKTKKFKVERSEKPHKKKPTDSSKTKKKHNKIDKRENKKTVKRKCPCKDTDSKKSKSVVQDVEEGKAKEDTTATEKSINETTSSPASIEKTEKVTTGEKLKKSHTTKRKNSETASSKPSKAKKHKVTDDTKTVKNKHRDPDLSSATRKLAKKSKIQEVPENKAAAEVESSAGEVGKSQEEKPDSSVSGTGYSVIINGRVQDAEEEKPQSVVAKEDEKAKPACDEGPPVFRRLSYKRLPPTAYLDEKYTNMPKRRKEMLMFRHSSERGPLEMPTSSTAPLQRQRCPSCFVCFCSAEELQTHLQLQTCSSLFGFDSDEEGSTSKWNKPDIMDAS